MDASAFVGETGISFVAPRFKVGDKVVYTREGHRHWKPQPGYIGEVTGFDYLGDYEDNPTGIKYRVRFDQMDEGWRDWVCRESSLKSVKEGE